MRVLLKEWRRRRLLTQEELARRSGVGVATIARIEAGQGARLSTLRKLADTLNVTPEQLLGETPESKAAA